MEDLERRKFQLHAKQDAYRSNAAWTVRSAAATLSRYASLHIEFSGGKDSLVTLHLVADQCGYDTVDVFHFKNAVLNLPGVTDYAQDAVAD